MARTERASVMDDPTARDDHQPTLGADVTEWPSTGANAGEGSEHTNGTSGAVEGSTDAGDAPGETADAKPKRRKRDHATLAPTDIVSMNVRIPNEFYLQIGKTAEEQQLSGPQLVAKMLADAFEYKLPSELFKGPRKKYSSEEERKAAAKQVQQKNRDTAAALIAAAKAGKLGVDLEALVADYQRQKAAEEAAKAEAEANTAPQTPESVAAGTTS